MRRFFALILCFCLVFLLSISVFAVEGEPDAEIQASSTPLYPSGNYSYISDWKTLRTLYADYFDAVIGSFRSAISALSNIYSSVDSVEGYLSDIKSYLSNQSSILTYIKSISSTISGYDAKFTSMVNKLTNIDTNTSGQQLKLSSIKSDVSLIKETDSDILSAVLGIDTSKLATKANQDTLNSIVSTASNQVVLNNSVASFLSLFSSGYDSYSFTAGENEWIVGVAPNSGSFVKGFNSASQSILEGIKSIASVVASPEDKAFSGAMNSSNNKQVVGDWNSANAGSSTSDSLLVGSTVIDNLKSPVNVSNGVSKISDMFNGTGQYEIIWYYFSDYCASFLDTPSSSDSVSALSLDDDSSLTDDNIVWFIQPNQSIHDRIRDFEDGR